jgi:nucleoredoxin
LDQKLKAKGFIGISAGFFLLILGASLHAENVKIKKPLQAYDLANPSKLMGSFLEGSELSIGATNRDNGMVTVTFQPKDGATVMALCKTNDLASALSDSSVEKSAPLAFGKSRLFKNIQNSLVDANGMKTSRDRLQKLAQSEYVLIYFSAHWCPPCRQFTPKFVEFYQQNMKKGKVPTDAIFVSSDKSRKDQLHYMKEAKMPWLAVDFSDLKFTDLREFAGRGIPCLVLLDSNGSAISSSYRNGEYVGPSAVLKDLQGKL